MLADLAAHGAQPVSLNPVRETLEDFFVRKIDAASAEASGARGLA